MTNCGEPTGPNGNGPPCQRDAGWGTEREIGPCKDHENDYRALRKLTPDVKSSIMGGKQAGLTDEHAAELAGITPNTLYNWKTWAQEDLEAGIESDLTDFYLDYRRARAAGAAETLRNCSPEFRAQASFGYTKKQEIEHSGEGGVVIFTEAEPEANVDG